jgi:hypothetical protein
MRKKVTFYLDHPTHSCYDVTIRNIHEPLSNVVPTIFHKLYPTHLHTYSTMSPSFIRITGESSYNRYDSKDADAYYNAFDNNLLDPNKSYVENNILFDGPDAVSEPVPEIRIRLKIHITGNYATGHT